MNNQDAYLDFRIDETKNEVRLNNNKQPNEPLTSHVKLMLLIRTRHHYHWLCTHRLLWQISLMNHVFCTLRPNMTKSSKHKCRVNQMFQTPIGSSVIESLCRRSRSSQLRTITQNKYG